MAYYLQFDQTDDKVDIPWTPPSTWSVKVDVTLPDTAPDDFVDLFSIYDTASSEFVSVAPSFGEWKIASDGKTPNSGGAIPYGTRVEVELAWTGSEFVLYVDGAEDYRVTPSSSTFVSSLNEVTLNNGPGDSGGFGIALYFATFVADGATIGTYDPSASNGTGQTLPDTTGTADGTLVNFPTDDSQWVEISTSAPATAPTVTVTAASTSADVSYTTVADATSYEYRLNGGTPETTSGNPFTISNLTASTSYQVEVRGLNSVGPGPWSDPNSFTTTAGTTSDITSPTNLRVANVTDISARLEWDWS